MLRFIDTVYCVARCQIDHRLSTRIIKMSKLDGDSSVMSKFSPDDDTTMIELCPSMKFYPFMAVEPS